MGACATKPLEATNKAPEEVHEENSTPRSAEVTPTPVETTAEEENKSSETVKEKVEEKIVDASNLKPTTVLGEQKSDNVERVPGDEPSKEKETVELIPVQEPNKEKETVELIPVQEPSKEKETVELLPVDEPNKEKETVELLPEKEGNN